MKSRTKNFLLSSALLLCGLLPFSAYAQLHITICGAGPGPSTCMDRSNGDTPGAPQGTGVDGVLVKDANGNDALKIPTNPNTPLATPAGWSGPTSPPSTAGAPTLTDYFCATAGSGYTQSCTTFTTPGAAATALANGSTGVVANTGQCLAGSTHCTVPGNTGISKNIVSTCPAGYTASGGVCNLTTPASVVKPVDGKPGVRRSGNTFVADSQDPDNATAGVGGAGIPISSGGGGGGAGTTGTVSYPAANILQFDTSDGRRVTVTLKSDGSSTVEEVYPTSTGNTGKEITELGPPASGTGTSPVTGWARTVQSGTGNAGAGGPAEGENCPAGPCATEGTLRGVKAGVDTINADGVKQKEQVGSWITSPAAVVAQQAVTQGVLDALKGAGNSAAASGNGTDLLPALGNISIATVKSSVLSFWDTYFPTSATCAPFEPAASGRWAGIAINLCPVVNALRPVLEWGLVLLTALSIYASWFGGREHRPGAATGNY